MALQIVESIEESSDASYINVTERSGVYKQNAPRINTNGFGGPNDDYTQVTSAIFKIKFPDPVTLMPQNDFYTFPATGLNYKSIYVAPVSPDLGFPNVVKVPAQILASAYGLDKFPMGIYEFFISFGGSWGGKIYKWKMRQAFIAQACCCVKALQSEIECNACEGQKIDDYNRGVVALAAVQSDMNCLKQQKTCEAIKRLIDICHRNPCGCGC